MKKTDCEIETIIVEIIEMADAELGEEFDKVIAACPDEVDERLRPMMAKVKKWLAG